MQNKFALVINGKEVFSVESDASYYDYVNHIRSMSMMLNDYNQKYQLEIKRHEISYLEETGRVVDLRKHDTVVAAIVHMESIVASHKADDRFLLTTMEGKKLLGTVESHMYFLKRLAQQDNVVPMKASPQSYY
jgi:hypothetical protein